MHAIACIDLERVSSNTNQCTGGVGLWFAFNGTAGIVNNELYRLHPRDNVYQVATIVASGHHPNTSELSDCCRSSKLPQQHLLNEENNRPWPQARLTVLGKH